MVYLREDNSNLKAYWKMTYWMQRYLEILQNSALERNPESKFVVNRAYYDSDAVSVNFSIDKKKHLLKMEIDTSAPEGYNLYLNGEFLPPVPTE